MPGERGPADRASIGRLWMQVSDCYLFAMASAIFAFAAAIPFFSQLFTVIFPVKRSLRFGPAIAQSTLRCWEFIPGAFYLLA